MSEPRVNWYENAVLLVVEKATDEILTRLAFQGEALAKVNIQANAQIDTGFMLNSVYGIGPTGDHRSEAEAQAGASAPREMMPAPPVAAGTAGIHAAADYAAFQEMRNSFLYRALEQLAAQAGGVIQQVGRETFG